MANGAAVAAAGAAAIANAIKASGVIVRVSPDQFQAILDRAKGGVLVHAQGGLFSTRYKYLVGYKGFAFYTKTTEPIPLPTNVEIIAANKIWVPD